MTSPKAHSPLTREAANLLGKRIREGRLERRWSIENLAERVGVSRWTMGRVEKGDLKVSLGTVFEAAVLVGVPLFTDDRAELIRQARESDMRLALLPATARPAVVTDDF